MLTLPTGKPGNLPAAPVPPVSAPVQDALPDSRFAQGCWPTTHDFFVSLGEYARTQEHKLL